ncbi:MAG: hypothetical protein IJH84_15355 [Saccharopolyspora sp.]|uniref:hypothetical protein n=1 Tax=Saccharopolyspora TaxID=1835 RepID=UPI001909AB91|nr:MULTISPECIES: hypothetical protein [unclassified Saccharopolyspora]MBK0870623.1 hypothetical protein [Saccharopolyspora sp. HNM0986]MBQ6642387.1 hypothetical protein [Saccharopolyspora sp.]
MPQHANGLHHHGYVERSTLSNALTAPERRMLDPDEVMHSPEEVAAWLAGTLRAAMGLTEDEVAFTDENQIWLTESRRGETIVTGLNDGPTITAEAIYDSNCECERQLKPVPAKKRR